MSSYIIVVLMRISTLFEMMIDFNVHWVGINMKIMRKTLKRKILAYVKTKL